MSGILRALVAALSLISAVSTEASDRPNIVLFLADNWAWPHAGTLGDPAAKTPTFDRIMREGALFENAFCPVPSCSPTRSCLLTGRPAHQLEDAASLWSRFDKKWEVFTDLLEQSGYEIGYSGKGLSPVRFREEGWDRNPVGPQFKDLAEFLKQRNPEKPFFFWIGNTDTALHSWKVDEPDPRVDPASIQIPPHMPDSPAVRAALLAYYSAAARMDDDAARSIAALEALNLFEDTLFIHTSDNGWQMPCGLANCYDDGTRVPLAMRWPGKLKPGSRFDEFIVLHDLAPTFLELAGLPVPEVMTARSFAPLLISGIRDPSRDHVFLERERHANVRRGNLSYPIRAIRTADHLYLRNLRPDRWPAGDPEPWFAVGRFGDCDPSPAMIDIADRRDDPSVRPFYELNFGKRPAEELYDLRSDPHQLHNLANDPEHSEIKRQLAARVDTWMRETGDPRIDATYDAWDDYPYYGGRVVDENGKPVSGKDRYPPGVSAPLR